MSIPQGATHKHPSSKGQYYKITNEGSIYYWSGTSGAWKTSGISYETSQLLRPLEEINASSVLDTQHGGDHYNDPDRLQPWEIINRNGYDYYEGNVLKYLDRHKRKNGLEDIEKAIHYLEAIKEFQYGQKDKT